LACGILYQAAIAIGAHRADCVPHLFEDATGHIFDDDEFGRVYERFAAVLMVI
jgi:hypothetical protein